MKCSMESSRVPETVYRSALLGTSYTLEFIQNTAHVCLSQLLGTIQAQEENMSSRA